MNFQFLLISFLSLIVVGCDYSWQRGGKTADKVEPQAVNSDAISFTMVNERIIKPHCVGCHSDASGNKGNVNLESYDSVFKNREAIQNEVSARKMPPRKKVPLTDDQIKLITLWIDQGALELAPAIDINPEMSDTVITGSEEVDPTLNQDLEQQTKYLSDIELKAMNDEAIFKIKDLKPTAGVSFPQTVITDDGYNVLIVDENRTAMLYESNSEKFDFKVKVDLTENLCQEEYVKPKCNYYFDFASDYLTYLWVKHSDNTKVGKILKVKSNGFTSYEEKKSNLFYGFIDRFAGRPDDRRYKPDRFVCDHYNWLDKNIAQTKQAFFQSWSAETMIMNTETGINENATSTVFEGMSWQLQKNALVLNHIERIQNLSAFSKVNPIVPVGQISTIQYQKAEGEVCQFSFSHSILAAAAGIDFDQHYNSKPRFVVYRKPKSAAFKTFKQQFFNVFSASNLVPTEFE